MPFQMPKYNGLLIVKVKCEGGAECYGLSYSSTRMLFLQIFVDDSLIFSMWLIKKVTDSENIGTAISQQESFVCSDLAIDDVAACGLQPMVLCY